MSDIFFYYANATFHCLAHFICQILINLKKEVNDIIQLMNGTQFFLYCFHVMKWKMTTIIVKHPLPQKFNECEIKLHKEDTFLYIECFCFSSCWNNSIWWQIKVWYSILTKFMKYMKIWNLQYLLVYFTFNVHS